MLDIYCAAGLTFAAITLTATISLVLFSVESWSLEWSVVEGTFEEDQSGQ